MTGLRARPSAETFPLDDLVEYARTGRLRVPPFQRGLRWTRRDVVQLFDSVLKGFPIGSLLLWERKALAEAVNLGPLVVDAPAGDAFYVVDGQQRITALAAALIEGGAADSRFAIGYDLDAGAFAARPSGAAETWIPAHVLYDLSTLLTWFRDREHLADQFDAAAAASKTLRDLRLPAYVVRQDDEEVLREIFDRTNNAGKKLSRSEVFSALHRSAGSAGDSPLASVAEQIEARTGFGILDEDLVMQVVLARRGADVRREIRNEFEPTAKGRDRFAGSESRDEAYRGGADAAVLAIEFVQEVAAVPHVALLPYQHLLVALARFFAHHPQPSARHRRLLRRFFWRAAVIGSSLVPGSTTGVSRKLNRAIVPGDELASISSLMATVRRARVDYPPVDPFRTDTAASKVLLCAMWQHGPKGLVSGLAVEDEELRRAMGDRQTAASVVVPILTGRQAGEDRDHERDAGNRLLLVPEEDHELDVIDGLGRATPDVLASHALEPDDLPALTAGSGLSVLAARAARLARVQRNFLDQMCEWDQEDTPDLNLLVQAEEAAGAPA